MLDSLQMADLVKEADEVYHSAGFVSYAPQDIDLLQKVNVEGTANIVNACLDNPAVRLCHVSSIAAINRKKGAEFIDEEAKWDAGAERSAYATSKFFAEMEVWRGISEGLKAVIVNPSIILGPGDVSRSSTQLFKYVQEEKSFYTHGHANFVDVRDVTDAIISLMEKEKYGERFILNGHQITYQAFFSKVAAAMGKKEPSIHVPAWMAEVLWRAEMWRGKITGAKPLITKETARIAKEYHFYSNDKIKKATDITFRPLDETITWCCQKLMEQNTVKN